MRYSGRISGWNDDRGLGSVTPKGGGDRAFVHGKAFERGGRRPVEGDLVSYEPSWDGKGRLNPNHLRFGASSPGAKTAAARDWSRARIALAAVALSILGVAWRFGALADIVPLAFALMSIATFVAYGIDKSAARSDRWRTPESTLHMLAVLCGWPGPLLAQALLRHKSRKAGFQTLFWVTVVLNIAALAWLLGSDHASSLPGELR